MPTSSACDTVEHLVAGISLRERFVCQTLLGAAYASARLANAILSQDEAQLVVEELEARAGKKCKSFLRALEELLSTLAQPSMLIIEKDALVVGVATSTGNGGLFTALSLADARRATARVDLIVVCDHTVACTLRILEYPDKKRAQLCESTRARLAPAPAPAPAPEAAPEAAPEPKRARIEQRLAELSAAISRSVW